MDDSAQEDDSSSDGIVQCLRLLAEEASALGLRRTLTALRIALNACLAESAVGSDSPGDGPNAPPPGEVIH